MKKSQLTHTHIELVLQGCTPAQWQRAWKNSQAKSELIPRANLIYAVEDLHKYESLVWLAFGMRQGG